MRYLILKPVHKTTLDPRGLSCADDAEFYRHLVPLHDAVRLEQHEYTSELETMYAVRKRYPDAVVMPVPVKVGVGVVFLLGVLPSVHVHHRIDPAHQDVPFVMFVRACADNADERHRMKKAGGAIYNEPTWRVPTTPAMRVGYALDGEFRSTNLKNPIPTTIMIAPEENGHRLVIHGDLGEKFAVLVNLKALGELLDAIREDVRPKSEDAPRAPAQKDAAKADEQRARYNATLPPGTPWD